MSRTKDVDEDLDAVLGCLVEPALARLATQLRSLTGVTDDERRILHTAAAAAIRAKARLKSNRVLILELNGARLTGALTASDSRARWKEWVAAASRPQHWEVLGDHYPNLSRHLRQVIDNGCAAALSLAARFAADRAVLGPLVGGGLGDLLELEFGRGDSHRGGQSVTILRCSGGRVVYKPRPLDVDVALARLLAELLADDSTDTRIRVPNVVRRDGYGWSEYIEHRHCTSDEQLRCFYHNLGHWLAVMRLLGGTDLHAENVVAAGPVPVVVDCETLFTPRPPIRRSGYGRAVDLALAQVNGSVLSTGLLPVRGTALAWRGVDVSAVGALPGQQPKPERPVVLDAGTDLARIGYTRMSVPPAVNHPSPQPMLRQYWNQVVTGFTKLTDRLSRLDRAGRLTPLIAGFTDCPIRIVVRSTETYTELGRMLWHPQSLYDEAAARKRAADVLAAQAENLPGVPSDPAVIDAEIDDLLAGDVPYFTTTPGRGRLAGPRGTTWGPKRNLLDDTLRLWRSTNRALELRLIRAGLVGAYRNEELTSRPGGLVPATINTGALDQRRRTAAAEIVQGLADSATRAEDGTVTWVAPVFNPSSGWAVEPLGYDMYSGLHGVAVVLAGYLSEMEHDRADRVADVPPLLEFVLRTMRKAERQWRKERAAAGRRRPESAGGYLGPGSRIWAWLLLCRFGVVDPAEAVSRAGALVADVWDAVTGDTAYELIGGMAGSVVPLLRFAEATADAGAVALAKEIGERLASTARVTEGTACWPTSDYPDGVGGLSHGVTGVGWALFQLAAATGDPDAAAMADAAFSYEETLYDPVQHRWRDLRMPGLFHAVWCHGAGGIGLVAADRLRHHGDNRRSLDVLRRAAAACWATGMGSNHSLCHGDLGVWETLRVAIELGAGPAGLDRSTVDAHILGSIEEHGPVSGLVNGAYSPGLLPGLGGVAYQLLRMHPDCPLPSVLLPDPGVRDRDAWCDARIAAHD